MNLRTLGLLKFLYLFTLIVLMSAFSSADDRPAKPERIKHRLTGLCCREREDDLRSVVKTMAGVTLVGIDFENAEATFLYDPAKLFPQDRAERYTELFDNLLKAASSSTFGINPAAAVSRDKLTLVEIPVVGLDCKGCCLGAYNAIYTINGVQRATASFKEGRVTALIDPSKTNRAALEAALKKADVTLKVP